MSIQSRADRLWDKLRNTNNCPVMGLIYVVPDTPEQDAPPPAADSTEGTAATDGAAAGWELVLREGYRPKFPVSGSGEIPERCPYCGRRITLDRVKRPDDHPLWTMPVSPAEMDY